MNSLLRPLLLGLVFAGAGVLTVGNSFLVAGQEPSAAETRAEKSPSSEAAASEPKSAQPSDSQARDSQAPDSQARDSQTRDSSAELDSQLLEGLDNDLDRALLEGLDVPPPAPRKDGAQGTGSDSSPKDASGKQPAGAGEAPEAAPAPGTAAEASNPLRDIGQRMQSVEQRIARYDTSAGTQEMQQRIVGDLDALIEQLEKQCANPSSSQQRSQGNSGGQSGGQGSQAAEQAASQPARDSTDRLGQASSDRVDAKAVEDVVKQVWGHLPPRVRELMRSATVEQFLPKYEQQIEAYYRRLAEEER